MSFRAANILPVLALGAWGLAALAAGPQPALALPGPPLTVDPASLATTAARLTARAPGPTPSPIPPSATPGDPGAPPAATLPAPPGTTIPPMNGSLAATAVRAGPAASAAASVVINEIVTDPQLDWSSRAFDGLPGSGLVDSADEWVELYIKAAGLSLSGWTLEMIDDTPASGSLAAGGAFAVARYVGAGYAGHTAAGDYLVLGSPRGSSLANTVRLVLRDSAGHVIDAVQLGDGQAPSGLAAGPEAEAVARFPNGADSDIDALDFTQQAATPGRANAPGLPAPLPTPGAAPGSVLINEIAWAGTLASAFDEWLELYNPGAAPVNLSGWVLADGNDLAVSLPALVIPPGGYLLLERTSDDSVSDIPADLVYTGGLNDAGEYLTLHNAAGTLIDSAGAPGSPWPAGGGPDKATLERGPAGSWHTHAGPPWAGHDAAGHPLAGTARSANSAGAPPLTPTAPPVAPPAATAAPLAPRAPEAPAPSLAELRTWPAGAWAWVGGWVTGPAGTFSPRTLYVGDGTAGIALYLEEGDWPPLEAGRWLQVLGQLRTRSGELQVLVHDPWHVRVAAATGNGFSAASLARPAATGQVGEALEGSLVTVAGRVTELEAQALWLDDGSGPVRVFFAAATGLARPAAALGSTWQATGLVVEFTTANAARPNFRLQPRWAADVASHEK